MIMRFVALLVTHWALIAVPALCRAGLLVDCCAAVDTQKRDSAACPSGCPNRCSTDEPSPSPVDQQRPEGRDCSACAEACNSVAVVADRTGGADLPTDLMPTAWADLVRDDGPAPALHVRARVPDHQTRIALPFPISDRPLLL